MAPMAALGCWPSRARRTGCYRSSSPGAAGAAWLLARGAAGTTLLYGAPTPRRISSLLGLFGRTLRPGREAIITRIARHVRGGTLPPVMERLHAQAHGCVVRVLHRAARGLRAPPRVRAARELVAVHQRAQLPARRAHVRGRLPLPRDPLPPLAAVVDRHCDTGFREGPRVELLRAEASSMADLPLVRHDPAARLRTGGERSFAPGNFLPR